MSQLIFPNINISIKEYQCPCCGSLPPDLMTNPFYLSSFQNWQVLRNEWGKPIPISKGGGYRCSRYQANLILAGKTNACCSPHFFWALDNDLDNEAEVSHFVDLIDARFPEMRVGYISYIKQGMTFVHLDRAYLVDPQPMASWLEGVRW